MARKLRPASTNLLSSSQTGVPQLCVLMTAFILFCYGIFDLVGSFDGSREAVEEAYLSHLADWDTAKTQLTNSEFFITYTVVNADGTETVTPEYLMEADKTEDRFSELVRAEHLPEYSNFLFKKLTVEPAGSVTEGDVWPSLAVPEYSGGVTFGPGKLSISVRCVHTDSGGAKTTSTVTIDDAPLGYRKTMHAKTPAPERKCPTQQRGIYNKATGKCDVYERLAILCFQVALDGATKEWVRGGDGHGGCSSSSDWSVGTYNLVKPDKSILMPDTVPTFNTMNYDKIEVHVRHSGDPFIYVESATNDSLSFGIDSHDQFLVGIIFVIVGCVLGINPFLALKKACSKSRGEEREKGFYSVVGEGRGIDDGDDDDAVMSIEMGKKSSWKD
jgi:hypothetical protein